MAVTQFVNSKFKSFKGDGTINASGTVEFFETGGAFSVYVSSYSDSSLTTANSNTITLDANGEADIWLGVTADVRIRNSAGATIDTFLNWNPTNVAVFAATTDTTLTSSSSGTLVRTTATITLPTASGLTAGWNVYIKNMSASNIIIARNFSSNTINGVTSNVTLNGNYSVWVVVNAGLTGFDLVLSPFNELGTGVTDQILRYGASGPVWATVDLKSVGNKLYLYSNFT